MAITYPVDLLTGFPGWTTGFSLAWRQEQSTQASGRVIVKDMGAPLWTLRATTKQLSPNKLDLWRASLTALENGLQTFLGYPMSRCYPQAYPRGSWPTGSAFSGVCSLSYIDTNRKAIGLQALPAWFVLTAGDYLSIAGDLHQVMETNTADGTGTTAPFEVRPHIWPDISAPNPNVTVKQPSCQMAIVPGSVTSDAQLSGWGALTFSAMEARL